jgi:hypothetical protein
MIARAPSWQVSLPSYRGDQINCAHDGAIEFRFEGRSDKQMRAAAANLRGGKSMMPKSGYRFSEKDHAPRIRR